MNQPNATWATGFCFPLLPPFPQNQFLQRINTYAERVFLAALGHRWDTDVPFREILFVQLEWVPWSAREKERNEADRSRSIAGR